MIHNRSTEFLMNQARSQTYSKHSTNTLSSILYKTHKSTARLDSKTGWSELHEAVVYGQTKKVQELFKKGVDLNLPSQEGKYALHYAVESANSKLVGELLKKGADAFVQTSDGKTALHIACEKDNIDLVKAITELDIRAVNTKDNLGRTPLHYAAQRENYDLFRYLCDFCNADINIADQDGKKSYQLAKGKIFFDFVRSTLGSPRLSMQRLNNSQSFMLEKISQKPKRINNVTSTSTLRIRVKSKDVSKVLADITNRVDEHAPIKSRPEQYDSISLSFQEQVNGVSSILSKRLDTSSDDRLMFATMPEKKTIVKPTSNGSFRRVRDLEDVENVDPNIMYKAKSNTLYRSNANYTADEKPKQKMKLNLPMKKKDLQQKPNMFSFCEPAEYAEKSRQSVQSILCEMPTPRIMIELPHKKESQVSPKQKPVIALAKKRGTRNKVVDDSSVPVFTFQNENSVKYDKDSSSILEFHEKNQLISTTRDYSTNYSSSTRPSPIRHESNSQCYFYAPQHLKDDKCPTTLGEAHYDQPKSLNSLTSRSFKEDDEENQKQADDDSSVPTLVKFYESWKAERQEKLTSTHSQITNGQKLIQDRKLPINKHRKEPVFEAKEDHNLFGCCSKDLFSFGSSIQEVLSGRQETLATTEASDGYNVQANVSVQINVQHLDLAFIRIDKWLQSIGLGCLAQNFKDNNYVFLKEFKDDIIDRPQNELIYRMGIDKVGHRAWLLFKLKEDFGELERKGLFKYAYEHPEYNFKYPTVQDWLKSNGWEDLTSRFLFAGYSSLEQLLMQVEFEELILDEELLETQLDLCDKALAYNIIQQIKKISNLGTTMSLSEIKQSSFEDLFRKAPDSKIPKFLKQLIPSWRLN